MVTIGSYFHGTNTIPISTYGNQNKVKKFRGGKMCKLWWILPTPHIYRPIAKK
jgi:hypothetical protein